MIETPMLRPVAPPSGHTIPAVQAIAPDDVGVDLGAIGARVVEGGGALLMRQLRIDGEHRLDAGAGLAHQDDDANRNPAVADIGDATGRSANDGHVAISLSAAPQAAQIVITSTARLRGTDGFGCG